MCVNRPRFYTPCFFAPHPGGISVVLKSTPDKSTFRKSVSRKIAMPRSAPVNLAPSTWASRKLAFRSIAFWKFVLVRSHRKNSTPLAWASLRLAPGMPASVRSEFRRSALRRFAPVRSAPGRRVPRKSLPERFAPVKSARAPPSLLAQKSSCALRICSRLLPLCFSFFQLFSPIISITPLSLNSYFSESHRAREPLPNLVIPHAALCYSAFVKPVFASASLFLLAVLCAGLPVRAQEDEIVANLAGGRTIIQVADDAIIFAAIEHPLEAKSVRPRVVAIDSRHIGILFGASEWQIPAQPQPIRLDRSLPRLSAPNPNLVPSSEGDQDLEQIGVAFLEKLRPLVSQLHHKIDLKPDEPLFQIILVGYAPQDYGPEVWQIDFCVEQESVATQGDFWQTRPLRPRFTQLYPPEKHQPKTLLELRFPADLPGVPLLGLIQQNDPGIARVRSSDPHFNKVVDLIERGEAQKADPTASADFLRDALPLIAGDSQFILGMYGERSGFQWIVPPAEPRVKEKTTEDKSRPADAPSLMRKPKP